MQMWYRDVAEEFKNLNSDSFTTDVVILKGWGKLFGKYEAKVTEDDGGEGQGCGNPES